MGVRMEVCVSDQVFVHALHTAYCMPCILDELHIPETLFVFFSLIDKHFK